MNIRFGEIEYSNIECREITREYVRLTEELLRRIIVDMRVNKADIQEFEDAFQENKNGRIAVLDAENAQVKAYYSGKLYSSFSNGDTKMYTIELREVSVKQIQSLVIDGSEYEPYEITQKMSQDALIIEAKIKVTMDEFHRFNSMRYREKTAYWSVIRKGISETPITMRFGRNLWSEKDGQITIAIVLVEDRYDVPGEKNHGFAEPELGIAMRRILQLTEENRRLLALMEDKGLITEEERAGLSQPLTTEVLISRNYEFDKVLDVDEWR